MNGPTRRLVRKLGKEYTVKNAPREGGDRETPNYDEDGTVTAVLEQRQMPRVERDSHGEEIEVNLELRVADADAEQLHGAGSESHWPTRLEHPSGRVYEAVDVHQEDGGVWVITVRQT